MSKILARWIEPAIAGKGVAQNGSTFALEVKVTALSGLGFSGNGPTDTLQVQTDNSSIAFDGSGNIIIKDAGVSTAKLADASVTGAKIGSATITGANIAATTIANGNIVDATITGGKIASATITGGNIASATITGGNVASATITGTNLAAATIAPSNLDLTQTYDIIVPASPSSANSATSKTYVDALVNGVTWKTSSRLATTGALPSNTYANGTSGVGATLTATTNGALTVDSVLAATNDRILVKNEGSAVNNGIYIVTNPGSGGAPYVLTRAADYNTPSETVAGTATFVQEGTVNADMGFVQITSGTIVLGTSSLVFTQFTGLGQVTAGAGLTSSGNTISAALTPVGSGFQGLAFSGVTSGTLQVALDSNKGIGFDANGNLVTKIDTTTGLSFSGGNIAVVVDTTAGLAFAGNKIVATVDGTTIHFNGSGQISIPANGVGPTQLDKTGTYDFATAGGVIHVTTQAASDNSTLAASTAFVQGAISASTGTMKVEYLTLSGADITNKYIDLAFAPVTAINTLVDIIGAGAQMYTSDFTVINNGLGSVKRLNWNSLGMDGTLVSGSMLRVVYWH